MLKYTPISFANTIIDQKAKGQISKYIRYSSQIQLYSELSYHTQLLDFSFLSNIFLILALSVQQFF